MHFRSLIILKWTKCSSRQGSVDFNIRGEENVIQSSFRGGQCNFLQYTLHKRGGACIFQPMRGGQSNLLQIIIKFILWGQVLPFIYEVDFPLFAPIQTLPFPLLGIFRPDQVTTLQLGLLTSLINGVTFNKNMLAICESPRRSKQLTSRSPWQKHVHGMTSIPKTTMQTRKITSLALLIVRIS